MATYFLRYTDKDERVGCGACAEKCPINAITMVDDVPVVDEAWCVGCGICTTACSSSAAKLKKKSEEITFQRFKELHTRIQEEKKRR